jgi:RNA polymerase sigma factor (sigma-70 family)
VRERDQVAWDALVSRYGGPVWATIRAHGLDSHEAADAAETTWLRLAQRFGAIRDTEITGAWLRAAARREALAALRRAGRHEPPAAELERGEAMRQALAELTPPQRRLMLLLAQDPRPTDAELAARLHMPIEAIEPTRRRCLDHLRARMRAQARPAAGRGPAAATSSATPSA